MTWTKLDDQLADDLLERSDSAFRLHIAAICYANRLGLDGKIPKARLQLVPVPPRTRRAATIKELIDAGLWVDGGETYTIVDFLRDQPSAEEVSLQRQWDALRQQIRFAKGPDRAEKLASLQRDADAKRDVLQALRNQRKAHFHGGITSESQRPVPLRPVPSRPAPSEDEDGTRKGAASSSGDPSDAAPEKDCYRCGDDLATDDDRISPVYVEGVGERLFHEFCLTYDSRITDDGKRWILPVSKAARR